MSALPVRWRYAAACVRGRTHVAQDMPCQDRLDVSVVTDVNGERVFVAVVSDGAGSARNAEAGAEAVVRCVAEGAVRDLGTTPFDRLGREHVAAWLEEARARVSRISVTQPLHTFAATVLVALVGPSRALYGQIGDGAIAVRRDDVWSLATMPQHGAEASSTRFFTDADWRDALEVSSDAPPERLVVMSDGVETLAVRIADMAVHGPTVDGLSGPVARSEEDGEDAGLSRGLSAWLDAPHVLARTHDDKSLVVAVRG